MSGKLEVLEELEWLNQRIARLEDGLQHYTMVEKDKALASITEEELNHLTTIRQTLLKTQEKEKKINTDIIDNIMAFKNDNANPGEVLNCLNKVLNKAFDYGVQSTLDSILFRSINTKAMVEKQSFGKTVIQDLDEAKTKIPNLISVKQTLLKVQEQEKENELLKEIIKSFFIKGCPLHQYTDKDFGLTVEVDNECSIMHLGKYKGIDLDEKLNEVLKEVLENE